jgi:hypothetical protein
MHMLKSRTLNEQQVLCRLSGFTGVELLAKFAA